jgi:hypothetical protein
MSTPHGNDDNSAGTGDPWIDAYLRFRRAVLDGATIDELTAFAAELKRNLPHQAPPPPAAMFIHHDIIITCGTSSLSPQLVTALWVPAGTT